MANNPNQPLNNEDKSGSPTPAKVHADSGVILGVELTSKDVKPVPHEKN